MVADNPAAAAAPAAPAAAPRTLALEGVRYRREPVLSYPESARQTGDQGTVLLRVRVNEQGRIEAVSLQRSSGSRLLDQAAQQQIRTALFEPYREQGVAQAVFVLVPLHYVERLLVVRPAFAEPVFAEPWLLPAVASESWPLLRL